MYYYYSEEDLFYYVSQPFGYALSYFGRKKIEEKNADLFRSSSNTITDPKQIFDYILNTMIFGDHYIEDTLIRKEIKKFSDEFDLKYESKIKNEEIRKMSKSERDEYYRDYDNKFKADCFEFIKPLLKNSSIVEKQELFVLNYSLSDKTLGFRIEYARLFSYENGEIVETVLPTRYLSCFIEDGKFIHVEPSLGFKKESVSLETPVITEKYQKEYKKIAGKYPNFSLSYEHMIKSAIDMEIIVKHK